MKTKEKETARMTSKIDNLEASLKIVKKESGGAAMEKNKIVKEVTKLKEQVSKLKERKPSVSKSTTTIPARSSEASTSTVGISLEPANKTTLSTQTDQHPDLPYQIDSPLPPIFSSSLVHKSKSLFLKRSHPDLTSIRWVNITDEDVIEQEIEEIEMNNYDTEIREFFQESAEKSRKLREIYEEGHIKKLFEENS